MPVNVHVKNAYGEAKFEVEEVKLISNRGLKNKDVSLTIALIEEIKKLSLINGMNIMEINVIKVWFDNENIFIRTSADEVKSHPLSWFPRLQKATKSSLENFTISPFGIYWEELDDDLSFEGFFNFIPHNSILVKK